jgi:hypothetical protein
MQMKQRIGCLSGGPSPPMSLPTPSQTAYVIQPYHDHRRHRSETPVGEAGARLDKVSSCFVVSPFWDTVGSHAKQAKPSSLTCCAVLKVPSQQKGHEARIIVGCPFGRLVP